MMADIWALTLGIVRGVAIVVAAWWVGGYLRSLALAWLEPRVAPTWRGILSQFVRFLPLVVVMQTVLEGVGIPATSYIAGVGAVGLAIALSLRDSLSNAASGAILLSTTPFHVGDTVTVGGVQGKVVRVGFITTELLADDGRVITLTNDRVFASNIERHGANGKVRVEVPARLPATLLDATLLERLRAGLDDHECEVSVVEVDTTQGTRLTIRKWCVPAEAAATREALALKVSACLRELLPTPVPT